jgi:hypothetical protein
MEKKQGDVLAEKLKSFHRFEEILDGTHKHMNIIMTQ